MQSNENKPLDARRFPEIFNSLTVTQQQELCESIIKLTGFTRMAITHWSKGNRTPKSLSTKRDIVRAFRQSLGIRTSTVTLFN